MTSPEAIVATNIRTAMKRSGMSQEQLSTRAGIPDRTLSRRLTGTSDWPLRQIAMVAEVFQVECSALLSADFDYPDQGNLPEEAA